MSRSIRASLAASALALVSFALGLPTPPPAAADALYPGDAAGTWTFGEVCEDEPWTRSYKLHYILNDATDYDFDDPDPKLTPGTPVRVDLAPMLSGPGLRGHVGLVGATSVAGVIPPSPPHPGDAMWQDVLSDATIGLAWEPDVQFMTVGVDVPLPDGWQRYAGALGFRATITTDGGEPQVIVMFAQPITPPCTGAWPTAKAEPSPAPSKAPAPSRAPAPSPSVDPSAAATSSDATRPATSPPAAPSPAAPSPSVASPSVSSSSPTIVPISAAAATRDAPSVWDARPWIVALLLVLVGGSIGLLAARYLPRRRR